MTTADRALALGAVTGFLIVMAGVRSGRPGVVMLGALLECVCALRLIA